MIINKKYSRTVSTSIWNPYLLARFFRGNSGPPRPYHQMYKIKALPFLVCLLACSLATIPLAAQNDADASAVVRTRGATYMGYRVEKGDTVYYDSINPIWIFHTGPGPDDAGGPAHRREQPSPEKEREVHRSDAERAVRGL